MPLYAKLMGFLDRHYQYRTLASDITKGLTSDRERALAVFAWAREHIRRPPQGWPIVDDHIWNIIIRGYGVTDQTADVFATLATYAGVPAFWQFAHDQESGHTVVLSFAQIDGTWAMFDLWHGLVFTDEDGQLARAEELVEHPEQVLLTSGALQPGGVPYPRYVRVLAPLRIPRPLRAQLQMPGPRLWHEARRRLAGEPQALVIRAEPRRAESAERRDTKGIDGSS
jgi:hypothetical protein